MRKRTNGQTDKKFRVPFSLKNGSNIIHIKGGFHALQKTLFHETTLPEIIINIQRRECQQIIIFNKPTRRFSLGIVRNRLETGHLPPVHSNVR